MRPRISFISLPLVSSAPATEHAGRILTQPASPAVDYLSPGRNWKHRDLRQSAPLTRNSRVFLHQVTVGHSRHVIANRAMQTFLIDPLGCDFAELARIGQVALKNFSQHLTRALVQSCHSRMVINVGVEKFSKRGVRLL